MLRNRRGATSLRWLRALLDHGIEVHGQVVVCPGVNDGAVLDDTLAGVLDRVPRAGDAVRRAARREPLSTPSRACGRTPRPRPRAVRRLRRGLAGRVPAPCSAAASCSPPTSTTCWPAGRSRAAEAYEGFPMHEDGIGMARTFELEFAGRGRRGHRRRSRASSRGSTARRPRAIEPYRGAAAGRRRRSRSRPAAATRRSAILTGDVRRRGARAAASRALGRDDVRVVPVENEFFGGNIGVTGLLVGEDLARVLADEPAGHRYLLPDVCLSHGRFLDGTTPADLPRPVEVVATDGVALRAALER